jgi:hypothetical protein
MEIGNGQQSFKVDKTRRDTTDNVTTKGSRNIR